MSDPAGEAARAVSRTVSLSNTAAEGIAQALGQDVYGVETVERMAWVVLLLKKCEDRPAWFPRGKWATIQHIERQIDAAVDHWLEVDYFALHGDGAAMSEDYGRIAARRLLRELARSFERDHECTCKPLCFPYTPPLTATGHKQGCPVDDAVRLDLAKRGMV